MVACERRPWSGPTTPSPRSSPSRRAASSTRTRKFVTYIFARASPDVILFLIYALAGGAIPLPLAAVEILAMDLGTETLQRWRSGREPAEPGIMRRPPDRREKRDPRPADAGPRVGMARLLEAALVTAAFFWLLTRASWSPGNSTGPGSNLYHAYLERARSASSGSPGARWSPPSPPQPARPPADNRRVLEPPGASASRSPSAAVVYLPPLQSEFVTASLSILGLAAGYVPGTGVGRRRAAPMGRPTARLLSRTRDHESKQDAGTAKGRLVDLLLLERIPVDDLP